MTLDVVNAENQKVDTVNLSDEVFSARVNTGLIWEAVIHESAEKRRGTHSTKTRGRVSGTGHKPWRQKGTGRARAGEIRSPLWRSGGIVFGPQPRSYAYRLPRKVMRGALRAAMTQKLLDGTVMVVESLAVAEPKTKLVVELLGQLKVDGRALFVDVKPGDNIERSARNLPGIRVVASSRLTARDVIDAGQLIVSKAAVEHLVKMLSS